MGVCYKLILEEEFNWGYLEDTKEEKLKEFEELYGGYIEKIAEWYGFVVYDIDKQTPYLDHRKKLIKEYADRAYYTDDLSTGIHEIDLPVNKPSVQKEIDRLDARRTSEAKRAAEEHVLKKMKKKGWI